MKNLTEDQQRLLASLRSTRRVLAGGAPVMPSDGTSLIAAVDLLDILLEGTPDAADWYFLRDGGAPDDPAWWMFSPTKDAWYCFYGDGFDKEDADDARETISDVLAGRPGSRGLFRGLDEGAAGIIETFGISA